MGGGRGPLRDALLDAAAELLSEHGYRGVRVQDVADAVGVSRQTVYNEFGDKWGLAQALVLRDNDRYLDGIDRILAEHDDLYTAVAAAVTFTLKMSADDPIKKAVLTGSGCDELLPLLTTRAEPVLFTARARLIDHALAHWPRLDGATVAEVADAAVRLVMSHVMLPAEPVERVARMIADMVTRYLGEPVRPEPQPETQMTGQAGAH
ncbi:TetR/AcrR family transcriptional regulator [Actinomadura craniellae]|uniref:TetR/AcrR family transcriptional regulator n=1 Tax=Actinomadura craniellae TaxID=2231787 RepID=A0A365GWB6_9ACTN|nr:TetR family transcriptional regulator [Actinomadura craniellae]RAY11117.1 TetR/AcrR family transcriptional regulator [Actinomadura craniellae]